MKTILKLKDLAIVLAIFSSVDLYAQEDLLAINTALLNPVSEQAASSFSAEDKVRIGDFISDPYYANATAHIRSVNPVLLKVFFYDSTGALAMESSMNLAIGINEMNIDMSSLEKGTYVVQFYSNEGSALRRITKKD